MPGKISEYTNNGNIEEWDLMDYSKETSQGSQTWETKSITFLQLKTALNLAVQDLPLGKADQTLIANRIIDGVDTYSLEVKDATNIKLKTQTQSGEYGESNFVYNQHDLTQYKSTDTANRKTTCEKISDIQQDTVGTQEVRTEISAEDGHAVIGKQNSIEEGNKILDRIVRDTNEDFGFVVINTLQGIYGDKDTSIDDDVIQKYASDGSNGTPWTIQLPTPNGKPTEQAVGTEQAKLWYSDFAGNTLSFTNGTRIKRVHNYGQKGYIQLTEDPITSGLFVADCEASYNFLIVPVSGANTISFSGMQDGDFCCFLIDDSGNSGFTGITLPANSKVANAGGGAIAFPSGKVSTATVTQRGSDYYWTYAEDYT